MSIQAYFAAVLTAPIIALATFSLPAKANNVEISCNLQQGLPTVSAKSITQEQAAVTILQFLPDYFSASTGLENCRNTAQALQKLNESGTRGYITSDVVDGQSLVCTVPRRGLGCDSYSSQYLFSFAPNQEPSQALYQMLGQKLKPAQPTTTRTLGRIYTRIDRPWWEIWRF